MTISHLVRRGVEAVAAAKQGDVIEVEVGSPWLAGLLFLTILGFAYVMFSIDYTYVLLVPTLAAVEDSNPEFYLRADYDPANKQPGSPTDADLEVETPAPRPITSKLRTTIRHLRARGGCLSRFRGFSMLLTALIAEGFVFSFVPVSSSSIVGSFVSKTIVAVLLANLHVAWVHIVISEPSPKRFYRRIPSFRSLPKIIPAAALLHLVTNGAYLVALLVVYLVHGLREIDLVRNGAASPDVYRNVFNILSLASFISWLASFPVRAIFVRVAASMLPTEDEAIVPFDRSFGGKVDPPVVGGSVLSIADAWKTFDRDGWKRYVKALAKAWAMQIVATILFTAVVFVEIMGGALVYKDKSKN
ncbi:hypothetical protein BJX76DRAFT_358115 [Aspergillus varians]